MDNISCLEVLGFRGMNIPTLCEKFVLLQLWFEKGDG